MFFQSIYQMMSAGTDLNINIRRTDGKLSVAVMPRRTTLKNETGQAIVPLILNGPPWNWTDNSCKSSPHRCRKRRESSPTLKPSSNRHGWPQHKARRPEPPTTRRQKRHVKNRKRWKNSSNVRRRRSRQEDTRKLQPASGRPRYSQIRTGRNR